VSAPCAEDRAAWTSSAALVILAHAGLAALALAWVRPAEPPLPDPVVVVELPEDGPAAPLAHSAATPQTAQPQVASTLPQALPFTAPPVNAPLPSAPAVLPQQAAPAPASQPASAPAAPFQPAVAAPRSGSGAGTASSPGSDPRAKRAEEDYFAQLSAYLNRRKSYPAEARQARQQGIVVVRFTVDRAGNVSAVSIKRGSGHDLLDRATLELLQRVAPLPRMPAAMQRDSLTISLPIDYSLRTS